MFVLEVVSMFFDLGIMLIMLMLRIFLMFFMLSILLVVMWFGL